MFRPYNPEQRLLFPEDVHDYLGPSHEANLIYEAVKAVFEAEPTIRAKFSRGHSREGRPAFDPEMMVCLLCYAYAVGVRSSRKVARLPVRDLGAYWLTAGERPDFRTVAAFRIANHDALEELFAKVLVLAGQLGMLKIGALTLDGTKIRANADSSMSNVETLDKRLKECRHIIAKILKEAGEADDADRSLFGDEDGTELNESLTSKDVRRQYLRDVASKLRKSGDLKSARKLDANRDLVERLRQAKSSAKCQKQQKSSITDPDSRFVKLEFGKIQPGYNAQAVVEEKSKIIVGSVVLQEANDAYAAAPAMADVEKHLGEGSLSGRELIADHGYFYAPNIEAFAAKGVKVLVKPEGEGNREYKLPQDARTPKKISRSDFVFHDNADRKLTFYRCPGERKLHFAGTDWLDSATKQHRRPRRRGWKYQSADCRGCQFATRCLGYAQESRKRRLLRDPLTDAFKDEMRQAFKLRKVRKRYTTRMYTVEPVFAEMKDKRGLRRFNLRGLKGVTTEWRWACLTHNLLAVARQFTANQCRPMAPATAFI